jgi:hypothetical protein
VAKSFLKQNEGYIMKNTIKITLLTLAGIQAIPAHAILSRLPQLAARFGLLQTSNPKVTSAAISGMPRLQIGSILFTRSLTTQQNDQATGDSSRSDSNNNSHNSQNRWQKAFLLCSLATASATFGYTALKNSRNYSAENNHVDSAKIDFEKFTQQFAPPQKMQRTIEAHREDIARELFGFFAGSPSDKTPDIFVDFLEDAIYRIINAERMRECIRRNKLTKLAVPRKYIYKLDDQWIIVTKYIHANNERKKLTLEEAQQLVLMAEETGYSDWGVNLADNIIIDKDTGKIAFVDTENGSFSECPSLFFLCSLEKFLDESAKKWLRNHIDELNKDRHHPQPRLEKLDKHNLDLTQVAHEYSQYFDSQRATLLKKYGLEMHEDAPPLPVALPCISVTIKNMD